MEGQKESTQQLAGSEEDAPRVSLIRRIEHHVWRRVLSGFLVLIPVLITFLTLRLIFGYVDGFFRPFFEDRDIPLDFPGIGVAISLAVLYVVGAFFAGKRAKAWQDAVLTRVPMVRSIYGAARQATDALSAPTGERYRRVVFIEWPRPGVLTLGFVTGQIRSVGRGGVDTVAVYIPTVPNPTSGMLAWLPEDQLIETHLTVEEAMKAVFSGGIVLPPSPELAGLETALRRDEEASP